LPSSSPAEAIELYRRRRQQIAAAVLDLTTPGISGEETLRQIKSIRPEVKVILSSGNNEVEVVQRFVGKGLAGFIQKPYSAAALVQKVETVLTPSSVE
jgi:DNA-binding NtrC family response regulator